jgi:hypothetical protein
MRSPALVAGVQSATKISSAKSGSSSVPRSTGMDQSGEDLRCVEMQRDLIARLRQDLQVRCTGCSCRRSLVSTLTP